MNSCTKIDSRGFAYPIGQLNLIPEDFHRKTMDHKVIDLIAESHNFDRDFTAVKSPIYEEIK